MNEADSLSEDQTGEMDERTLLSGDATGGPRAGSAPGLPGSRIGRFMILRKLGEGGMGVVYAAYDEELDRKVAIKLLSNRQFEVGDALTRMTREAKGLARLSHPNVVQIHEIGQHDGSLFIAMEYVRGRTLKQWLAETSERRGWREILEVLIQAGRGLEAAHLKRLVHRDFKPDNVMVAKDGRVRVLDFGLARDDGRDNSEAESDDDIREGLLGYSVTRTGMIVGTPAYMAIEQLAGGRADAQSDQFMFCVVVFESLYGERPFAGDNYAALTLAMAGGEIRPRPADTEVPQVVHDALVRGLAARTHDRWPNMTELLEVLERSLGQHRRSRGWLVGGLLSAVVLAAAATPLIVRALAQRDALLAEQRETIDETSRARDDAFAKLEQTNEELRRELAVERGLANMLLADTPGRGGEAMAQAIEIYADAVVEADTVPAQIEAAMFATTRTLHDSRVLDGCDGAIAALEFSPQGAMLAAACGDDAVKIWDTRGKLVHSFEGGARSLEFHPLGDRLLTTGSDGTVRLWRIDNRQQLLSFDGREVGGVSIDAGGRWVALGSTDGSLTVLDGDQAFAERVLVDSGPAISAVSFSPSEPLLAAADAHGRVRVWAIDSGAPVAVIGDLRRDVDARTLDFSPDGRWLAAPGRSESIVIWDRQLGSVAQLERGRPDLRALAFTPSSDLLGSRLVSWGAGGLDLWDVGAGAWLGEAEGQLEAATAVAFAPDGRRFVTSSLDSLLRVYDSSNGRLLEFIEIPGEPASHVVEHLAFSPDGAWLASSSPVLRLWQTRHSNEARVLAGGELEVLSAVVEPALGIAAFGDSDGRVTLWELTGGRMRTRLGDGDAGVWSVAISGDGTRVAAGDERGVVRVYDSNGGEVLHQLERHADLVKALAFSADGQTLASASLHGVVRTWRVGDGVKLSEWRADAEGIGALAFIDLERGPGLITGGWTGGVQLWTAQGERLELLPFDGPVLAVAVSPDGRRLAIAGLRREIDIWELGEAPSRRWRLRGQDASYDALEFSADGRRLISASAGFVRLWSVDDEFELADLATHRAPVRSLAISSDGRRLFSAAADGELTSVVVTASERLALACRALREHPDADARAREICEEPR